jgi:hypothetical protein
MKDKFCIFFADPASALYTANNKNTALSALMVRLSHLLAADVALFYEALKSQCFSWRHRAKFHVAEQCQVGQGADGNHYDDNGDVPRKMMQHNVVRLMLDFI